MTEFENMKIIKLNSPGNIYKYVGTTIRNCVKEKNDVSDEVFFIGKEFDVAVHDAKTRFPDMMKAITDIATHMKNYYGLTKEDNAIFFNYYAGSIAKEKGTYWRFLGTMYDFSDMNIHIRGKVFVLPLRYYEKGVLNFCYVFRAQIEGRYTDYSDYNIFCRELEKLAVKDLQLQIDPTPNYLEPKFYTRVDKLDIESFKEFMKKINRIAEVHTLRTIS